MKIQTGRAEDTENVSECVSAFFFFRTSSPWLLAGGSGGAGHSPCGRLLRLGVEMEGGDGEGAPAPAPTFDDLVTLNLSRHFVERLSDVCGGDGALDMAELKRMKGKALVRVHPDTAKTDTPEYTVDEVRMAYTWLEEHAATIKTSSEAVRLREDFATKMKELKRQYAEARRRLSAQSGAQSSAQSSAQGAQSGAQSEEVEAEVGAAAPAPLPAEPAEPAEPPRSRYTLRRRSKEPVPAQAEAKAVEAVAAEKAKVARVAKVAEGAVAAAAPGMMRTRSQKGVVVTPQCDAAAPSSSSAPAPPAPSKKRPRPPPRDARPPVMQPLPPAYSTRGFSRDHGDLLKKYAELVGKAE